MITSLPDRQASGERGPLALLWFALPIFLSNGLWAIQVVLDRILLSWSAPAALGAGTVAALLFWTPMVLLTTICGYVCTFVAQASGAGQPRLAGRALWQGLYAAVVGGLLLLGLAALAGPLAALGGHSGPVREMEAVYLRYLCLSAFPALVGASVSGFLTGRGEPGKALLMNGAALAVNLVLAYVLIFGAWGGPAWGIAGAGLASVAGAATAAGLGLAMLAFPAYRPHALLAGWRWDGKRFRALLRYGLPAGAHSATDTLAWALFLLLVGRLGEAELAATSIAFTVHLFVLLPLTGLSQAITVQVGQHVGEGRPALAERVTSNGLWLAVPYLAVLGLVYLLAPWLLLRWFEWGGDSGDWEQVAGLARTLLFFQSAHALCEGVCLVYSHALRGAGDTRFLGLLAVLLPWPTMLLPTWLVCAWRGGLYWAWGFATLYVAALALSVVLRFRAGHWKRLGLLDARREAPQPTAP
jgi:MATE family multidrug resistance protein